MARAFKLFAAGPLAEARFVGGVSTRARTAFAPEEAGGYSPLNLLRRRAERDLPSASIEGNFRPFRKTEEAAVTIAPIETALVDFIDDCLPDEVERCGGAGRLG